MNWQSPCGKPAAAQKHFLFVFISEGTLFHIDVSSVSCLCVLPCGSSWNTRKFIQFTRKKKKEKKFTSLHLSRRTEWKKKSGERHLKIVREKIPGAGKNIPCPELTNVEGSVKKATAIFFSNKHFEPKQSVVYTFYVL